MGTNWTDDDVDDRNPLEPEGQGAGLGVIVWLLLFAFMTIVAGLLAAAGALLGG